MKLYDKNWQLIYARQTMWKNDMYILVWPLAIQYACRFFFFFFFFIPQWNENNQYSILGMTFVADTINYTSK